MSTPEQRSSGEVRSDIERTRADLDETIDALEERLSPRELADQAWRMLKGEGRGLTDVIRDHPMPAALMGLGVAWLAIEQGLGGNADRHAGTGTTGRAEGRVGPYRGDAISGESWSDEDSGDSVKQKASDAAHAIREKAGDVADTARSMAGEAKHRVQDTLDAAGERASEGSSRTRAMAGDAKEAVRHGAERARRGVRSVMHDSPLAAGAVAFGLGLASGLAVPTTDAEDRLMGDTADRLKRSVADEAKRAGEQSAAVAADAAGAAMDEAGRQDVGERLQQTASRIGREAKQAASRRADEEGLSAEGLQERARRTVDETRHDRR